MIKSLLRLCDIIKGQTEPDQFEPVYGLSPRSRDEWLSRNPALKEDYEADLLIRTRRSRSARVKRLNRIQLLDCK
jgi:hypothetical protein